MEGFDTMVRLSDSADVIILEGDEYLSSAMELRPKFHFYKPHTALLSGIKWDHINVFPTFENYLEQFSLFVDSIPDKGNLIYYVKDKNLQELAAQVSGRIKTIKYDTPSHEVRDHKTYLKTESGEYELAVFGDHNLQNLEGARLVCETLGIEASKFYQEILDFKGAARRLDLLGENKDRAVFRDFAHAPSKLKASVEALHKQYPERKLLACLELHTFSSLSREFLDQYAGSMDEADYPMIFYDPKTLEAKKLASIYPEEIQVAFANSDLQVYTVRQELLDRLSSHDWKGCNLVMMSSGNFDGIDFDELTKFVLNSK